MLHVGKIKWWWWWWWWWWNLVTYFFGPPGTQFKTSSYGQELICRFARFQCHSSVCASSHSAHQRNARHRVICGPPTASDWPRLIQLVCLDLVSRLRDEQTILLRVTSWIFNAIEYWIFNSDSTTTWLQYDYDPTTTYRAPASILRHLLNIQRPHELHPTAGVTTFCNFNSSN